MNGSPTLRPATADDVELLFGWRNRPEIVALGASNRSVKWHEHTAWFAGAMADEQNLLFIVQLGEEPIGHVRFTPAGDGTWAVSIYLLAPHTGKGLGPPVLAEACRRCFAQLPAQAIEAVVLSHNARSQAAFRGVGFVDRTRPARAGDTLVLELARPPYDSATMPDPFQKVADFFNERIARQGATLDACDYAGPEAQQTRFRVLADVGPLAGKRVLDVGCGFADWSDYLAAHVGPVEYSGVDLSSAMIAEAKRRHPDLDVRVANILDDDVQGSFDVVVANGIFYLLGDEADALMRSIVSKMFSICRQATVFTTLSSWGPREPGEFYADPVATLEFCRTLTPWVTLRHDYHVRDFAMYLNRDRLR